MCSWTPEDVWATIFFVAVAIAFVNWTWKD